MDKTKLPNLQEIGDYAGKFYDAIKTSLGEIYDDYKAKHQGPLDVHEPDITDNEAGLKKSSVKKNAKKKQ